MLQLGIIQHSSRPWASPLHNLWFPKHQATGIHAVIIVALMLQLCQTSIPLCQSLDFVYVYLNGILVAS